MWNDGLVHQISSRLDYEVKRYHAKKGGEGFVTRY
jgi:hypothetical protein